MKDNAEDFLGKLSELLINNEYSKIFRIICSIFILSAPSTTIIYLYKKDIFVSLDFSKLMLLIIILNIMFIIITILIVILATATGYSIECLKQEKLMDFKENEDEKSDNYKEIIENNAFRRYIKSVVDDVMLYIILFTGIIWGKYIFNFIIEKSYSYEDKMNTLYFSVIFIQALIIINAFRNILVFNKMQRERFKNEKQDYHFYFDKANILNLLVCFVIIIINVCVYINYFL